MDLLASVFQPIAQWAPVAAILVSAIAAFLILACDKRPNLREGISLAAAVLKFLLIASLHPVIESGREVTVKLFEILPHTPCILKIDALGFYFALLSSGLWIVTTVYSIGYMRTSHEKQQTRFYFSFALSLSAAVGIAFSGDLITFFLFYELLTLATYPLVAHKETKEAVKAGRKYLVYSLTSGIVLLLAIVWLYRINGTVAFQAGGLFTTHALSHKEFLVLFFMLIYGCGVKGGLFPVHAWLPSAMVAPTPVSALLHAVAVVKAGVFGILRVTGFVFGPELMRSQNLGEPLAWIAAFTILGASCIALAQDNLKRRLAYSTISQLAYIILGTAMLTPSAYSASILHLANHAFMKITLFFCAGAIYACSHKENISDMAGLGRRMPLTFTAFAIGSLGLAGFPLFNGFISKWFFCKGAIEAGSYLILCVYLLSAFLNIAYLFPVVLTGFRTGHDHSEVQEKPWTLIAPLLCTATLVLLFGCVSYFIRGHLELAEFATSQVFWE